MKHPNAFELFDELSHRTKQKLKLLKIIIIINRLIMGL